MAKKLLPFVFEIDKSDKIFFLSELKSFFDPEGKGIYSSYVASVGVLVGPPSSPARLFGTVGRDFGLLEVLRLSPYVVLNYGTNATERTANVYFPSF